MLDSDDDNVWVGSDFGLADSDSWLIDDSSEGSSRTAALGRARSLHQAEGFCLLGLSGQERVQSHQLSDSWVRV
jgi:hypothetical protein